MAENQKLHLNKELTLLPHDYQNGAQRMRFFDVVSVDALFVMVKYLSEAPHSEQWLETVNASDVLTVLQSGGVLGTVSRRMFKSLNYDDLEFEDSEEHELLIRLMAPHLECVHIYEPDFRGFEYERLCSLHVLKLAGCENANALERILTACSDSLLELHFYRGCMNEEMVQAIANHCKSLKVFSTSLTEYRASLEPIWSAVGSTLIEIRGEFHKNEFIHIARHCLHIEKLDIWHLRKLRLTVGDAVSESIVALKSLRALDLGSMSFDRSFVNELRTLLDVCPSDVHVHSHAAYVEDNDTFADFIRVIGIRLYILTLNYEIGTVPRDVLPAFANIEKLILRPWNIYSTPEVSTVVESIFIKPMPNLHGLSISCVNNPKMLAIIAHSVSNLRKFSCSFDYELDEEQKRVPVKGSAFTELLDANKHLLHIDLNYGRFEDFQPVMKAIADFIPRLKVCNYLKDVSIAYQEEDGSPGDHFERFKEINDACVSLRTKPLSLLVNYFRYLPS